MQETISKLGYKCIPFCFVFLYQKIGYYYILFKHTMGELLLLVGVAIIVLLLLRKLMMASTLSAEIYRLLSNKFMFNCVFRVLIQSYLQFTASAFLGLSSASRFVPSLFTIFVISLPGLITVFLLANRAKLQMPFF